MGVNRTLLHKSLRKTSDVPALTVSTSHGSSTDTHGSSTATRACLLCNVAGKKSLKVITMTHTIGFVSMTN